MLLSLIEIVHNPGARLEFSRTLDLSDVILRDGTRPFTNPVTLSGAAINFAGDLRLEAVAEGVYEGPCARCLAPMSMPLRTGIAAAIRHPGVNEGELEVVALVNNAIDLCAIAEDALVAELPIQPLCREDCAGLCPRCGQDLNAASCGCVTE